MSKMALLPILRIPVLLLDCQLYTLIPVRSSYNRAVGEGGDLGFQFGKDLISLVNAACFEIGNPTLNGGIEGSKTPLAILHQAQSVA